MNFVVITLDTLRYDFVGANGNDWIRTPNLDRFARQAVCFDRAYAGSFPTVPYRTDVFTGRFGRPFHPWAPLAWEAVTLPELMRNAGFVTMLVHDTPHLVTTVLASTAPSTAGYYPAGGGLPHCKGHKQTSSSTPTRCARRHLRASVRNFRFRCEEDHSNSALLPDKGVAGTQLRVRALLPLIDSFAV